MLPSKFSYFRAITANAAINPQDPIDDIFDIIIRWDINSLKNFFLTWHLQFRALPPIAKYLLVANIIGWIMWKINPHFMINHASLRRENLTKNRFHTLFLSNFSHQNLFHLYGNMVALLVVIKTLQRGLSTNLLLVAIALSSAATSLLPIILDQIKITLLDHRIDLSLINMIKSFLFNFQSKAKREQRRLKHLKDSREAIAKRTYIGFSGINICLFCIFAYLRPKAEFPLQFIEDTKFSAKEAIKFLLKLDLLGLLIDTFLFPSSISHAGHIGGFLAGMVVDWILRRSNWGWKQISWRGRLARMQWW